MWSKHKIAAKKAEKCMEVYLNLGIKISKMVLEKRELLPVMGILSPSISRATKLNQPEFSPVL
jgi:hypothetical protein